MTEHMNQNSAGNTPGNVHEHRRSKA